MRADTIGNGRREVREKIFNPETGVWQTQTVTRKVEGWPEGNGETPKTPIRRSPKRRGYADA